MSCLMNKRFNNIINKYIELVKKICKNPKYHILCEIARMSIT